VLDLNDAALPSSPLYDMDELSLRLAASASSWVPQYFPQGRINDDRSELRLANISGAPPRKTGSCVIGLTGEMAGKWHDFDGGDGGGPLSTLKHASGKDGRDLLDLAAEIVGTSGPQKLSRSKNVATTSPARAPRDPSAEIAHILARSVPIAGTLAETYLKSRGLEPPGSPDLLFCANVTDWKAGVGRPAMIAIPRRADGDPTGGVHRTFLAYDGSAKAEMDAPKKMLGPMENGSIRLAQMGLDGRLGIAEGVETALAAMALYGLPVWAATAAPFLGGRDRSGSWIGFVPPTGITELYIFADAGAAGLKVAKALMEQAQANGLPAAIIEPAGEDDFNADLLAGAVPKVLPDLHSVASVTRTATPDVQSQATVAQDVALAIGQLTKDSPPQDIEEVIRQVALAGATPLATQQMLKSIRDRTGAPARAVDLTLKNKRVEIKTTTIRESGGGEWMGRMLLTDSGEPRPVMENAATVFEMAPEFAGVLWFDDFGCRPMMRRPAPWDMKNGTFTERPWTDADDSEATRWLQRAGVVVPSMIAHEAALTIAYKSAYHPVREYLGEMEWDRKDRLDFWASDYLGAEESAYTRAVGARWMISAVARIMQPGIKADHLLILEGEQGTYKSAVLRALFDPWFSDDPAEMGSKDASIQLSGIWCMEYADLDRFGRADRNRLKAFVSRQVDRYRAPFGRYAADHPRQIVFAGTTNEGSYLDDPTGGRRFWPLKSPRPDHHGIAEARDQLWAEAFYRYNSGEKFYLTEADLKHAAVKQQRARQHEEAWGRKIKYFLQGGDNNFQLMRATVSEILEGIGIPADRWNTNIYNRVRDYLQFIGWVEDENVQDGRTFLRPE
jgi:hypothetical protein